MRSSGVPAQDLRGADATLLEVQVPDLWKLPLGQVSLLNVLDLFELAVTEACPKVLKSGLQSFVDHISREVVDLPAGAPFDAFVASIAALEPARVPQAMRDVLNAQAQRRGHEGAQALVEALSAADPLAFTIGLKRAKVQRAAIVEPRKRASDPSSAPIEGGAKKKRRAKAEPSTGIGRANPPAMNDLDRLHFLQQIAMERLVSTDKGLMEAVLVAGIRHLAKDEYSDVTPKQVVDALKLMKADGRARYSAGRWMGTSRY